MRQTVSFFLFWILFFGILAALFVGTWWYWDVRRGPVEVTLDHSQILGPRDPVVLRFSQAVQPHSFDTALHIEPAHPLRIEWNEKNHVLLLIPEADWPLESKYQVTLAAGKTRWFGSTPRVLFRLEGPRYPKIVETIPAIGAQDVLLGIEDPIQVTFDRSVKDFFIDFRFDPPMEVVYQNNPEKTQFDILPKNPIEAGQKYSLKLYAKWRGASDDVYQFLSDTSFTTRMIAPQSDVVEREESLSEEDRASVARKSTGKYIDINLSNQTMTLFENGKALDAYLISSGKKGMDTPKGEFSVQNKVQRPWSKAYGLYMPYWQAITPDGKYGIHELPEWPGGYKEGANHLGTPVSHGCVRLGVGAAERVYAWSEVGTPIIIY